MLDAVANLGLNPAEPAAIAASTTALTPTQTAALAKLHTAATQLEGVFLGMMMKEMRATVPENSLFGSSPAETTFNEMLDEQRSQSMAGTGMLGVAKIMENQLRSSVLSDAAHEAKVGMPAKDNL